MGIAYVPAEGFSVFCLSDSKQAGVRGRAVGTVVCPSSVEAGIRMRTTVEVQGSDGQPCAEVRVRYEKFAAATTTILSIAIGS